MYSHKVCVLFNLSRKLYLKKIPLASKLIRLIIRVIFSCDLPYTADIHPSVDFMHNGLGVVIHARSKIGKGTVIYQNVTLGGNGKGSDKNGPPILGDNVTVGAGAVIIGPIRIGNNVKIGANAVVIDNIPDNSVAVGIPARVIESN